MALPPGQSLVAEESGGSWVKWLLRLSTGLGVAMQQRSLSFLCSGFQVG